MIFFPISRGFIVLNWRRVVVAVASRTAVDGASAPH